MVRTPAERWVGDGLLVEAVGGQPAWRATGELDGVGVGPGVAEGVGSGDAVATGGGRLAAGAGEAGGVSPDTLAVAIARLLGGGPGAQAARMATTARSAPRRRRSVPLNAGNDALRS